MSSAAPDSRRDARPPIPAAPSGAAAPLRPTAVRRCLLRPRLWETGGIQVTDPYVRRFWSAALTGGAVGDLLRLVEAGRRGVPVRRPLGLALLAEAALVRVDGGSLWVRTRVPPVPADATWSWPGWLRAEHADAVAAALPC